MVYIRVHIPSLGEVFGFEDRWLTASLSLLDNAKESILHGLQHYLHPDPSPSDFKQAIVNLHLGFKLALKEALRRKHEAFILGRFDVDTVDALIRGARMAAEGSAAETIRTIPFEEAVSRARKLLNLGPEHAKFLLQLNRLRRAAVHYSFRLDQRLVDRLLGLHLGRVLRVVLFELLADDLSFISAAFKNALEEVQKRVCDPIALNLQRRIAQAKNVWEELSDAERKAKVASALGLRKHDARFEVCPVCSQQSLERTIEWRVIDEDPEGRPIDIPVTIKARCACCPFEIEKDEAEYYCDWKGLAT